MPQRDLAAELRASRPAAPPEVRARVRATAATVTPPRRVFTWRRALVVVVPAAAAAALVAAVVATRPAHRPAPVALANGPAVAATEKGAASAAGATRDRLAPPAARGRVQRYGAFLSLRVPRPDGVSDGVKRALRIAASLGGHATSVRASTGARTASADLTLKIPRARVQEAVARLSSLGTISGEQLDIQDLEAGLDAAGRTIARLQARLAELRRAEQTDAVRAQIEQTTAQVERLQRARARTLRDARFATVSLHLQTAAAVAPPARGHGPFHGLGVAFRWLAIGALYALALGTPLAALVALAWLSARAVRRRRENSLLEG